MALDVVDVHELIRLLRENPELRDAARKELVDEDLRALPLIVRGLSEAQLRTEARLEDVAIRLDQLTARVDTLAIRLEQLTARVDTLTIRLEQLTARVDTLTIRLEQLTVRVDTLAMSIEELTRVVQRIEGRFGNIEGWQYEARYHAASRVTEFLRRPVELKAGGLDQVLDAREDGLISRNEWQQLHALDFLFYGRAGRAVDSPMKYVALEVSLTIDESDVARAYDRANLLIRCGLETIAVAGGQKVTGTARRLAADLGVELLMDRSAEPANAEGDEPANADGANI